MDVVFTDGGTYIPKWNGNQSLPEDSQIKVEWKYPTVAQRNRIRYFAPMKVTEQTKMPEVEYVTDTRLLVETCITLITGLKINGVNVDSGKKLIEAKGCGELFDELAGLMIQRLDVKADDLKNSQ